MNKISNRQFAVTPYKSAMHLFKLNNSGKTFFKDCGPYLKTNFPNLLKAIVYNNNLPILSPVKHAQQNDYIILAVSMHRTRSDKVSNAGSYRSCNID